MKFPVRVAALAFAGGLAYSLAEPQRITVRRFDVALPELPAEVDGLTIAQVSDLHCSAITGVSFLRRVVDVCNAQQADVVALTGDFVSRHNSYMPGLGLRRHARDITFYAGQLVSELRRLKANDSVLAVPGNHDHTEGNCDYIGSVLANAGVRMLVNESVVLRGVLPVVGLDDLRAGRPRLCQAAQGISPDSAQLVLCHNPRFVTQLADRNCLVLAGHTHGGQVHLPGINFRSRPHDMHFSPWHQGWYRYHRAQMFVSVGVGSVAFPMRFACPPEIVVFTLRRARTG